MIDFKSGTLYIGPLSNSDELINLDEVNFEEEPTDIVYVNKITGMEETFEVVGRAAKECLMALLGVKNAVLDMYPNKRVVYLAKHGKKRTRKKNFKRAIKILEENNK